MISVPAPELSARGKQASTGAFAMRKLSGRQQGAPSKEQKQPAEAAQGEKRPLEDEAAFAAARRSMLTGAGYQAKKGSEDAEKGLQVYASLSDELKREFVAQWAAQPKSTRNALKWTFEVRKQFTEERSQETGRVDNVILAGVVLQEAGLSWEFFKGKLEEGLDMARKLARQNAELYRQEYQEFADPGGDPMLYRFAWVKSLGQATKMRHTSGSSAQAVGVTSAQGMGEMLSGAPSSADAPGLVVKTEHPKRAQMKEQVQVLNAGLSQLQQQLNKADTLASKLSVKAKVDTTLASKAAALIALLSAERAWCSTALQQASEWEDAACFEEKAYTELLAVTDTLGHKLDALKSSCKRHAALLA
jgi:hypothetical protein